jgi:uncharacterized protein (DUF433 family)
MTQRETRSGAARQRSFRLPVDLLDDLEVRAKEVADSANGLASRLLHEGLRTDRHPLIGFREGPNGQRRPALVGTRLFIWQVVQTLRDSANSVEDTAEYLGLSVAQVRAVINYYADFQEEVDRHAAEAREFEERERERWERAQRVLS